MRHIIIMLFAAAGVCLLAASGVSCAGSRKVAPVDIPPSPDTLALVEGLRLFEEGEFDLARGQLSVSAQSASTYIRAESFLYLNALEMELGNYEAAHPWLDKYHLETVRLLRSAADASQRMSEQAARLRRRHDTLVGGMIVVVVLAVGTAFFFIRRRRSESLSSPALPSTPSASPPSVPPLSPSSLLPPQAPSPDDVLEWRRWLVDAEIFKQTAIYAEVARLAAQKPGREAKVLPSPRQEVLDSELAGVFSDFAARLREDYPALTAGDVKLCCLSLLPLSAFGRALCFGSTETNIIKQRKHTIKKKLGGEECGRALFEFIFETKG